MIGTIDVDIATSIKSDGNKYLYITGATKGSLSKNNAGGYDNFIKKIDKDGN